MGEAEMSYAGPNAFARAKLAGDVVWERMRHQDIIAKVRVDVIGAESVFAGSESEQPPNNALSFDGDYRVRVCLISQQRMEAQTLVDEMQSLYCSGPAAGGGFRGHVTEQIATASVLIDRNVVEPHVRVEVIEP